MKRKLIVSALVLGLCAGSFTGCGNNTEQSSSAAAASSSAAESSSAEESSAKSESTAEESTTDVSVENETNASVDTDAKLDTSDLENAESNANVGLPSGASFTEDSEMEMVSASKLENVDYVMIYNPQIYSEDDYYYYPEYLSTGDMSGQILTGSSRAGSDALDVDIPLMADQTEMIKTVDSIEEEREEGRAGGLAQTYSVGDTENFYYSENVMTSQEKRANADFTCQYAGEYCYIWVLDDVATADECSALGEEFDNLIFDNDTEAFGVGRFTDNGGKVNLLVYPMGDRVGGFQSLLDIFATGEYSSDVVEQYGLNLDKAIININSDFLETNIDYVYSTLAHEYQHQICASDCFYYNGTPWMKTWLNEAMSAAAEEISYDGIMNEGEKNMTFYASDYIRNGQSLYNFTYAKQDETGETVIDDYVGCYSEVYLFSEYLKDLAGDDVFYNIHDFWRNSYSSDITEAQALYSAFETAGAETTVDSHISYNSEIESYFNSEEDEWMSKLDLGFLLKTLDLEYADLEKTYSGEDLEYLEYALPLMSLYTNIDPVDIEGGGRIIVATADGSYTIPEDADDGLIYVGLDENMNVVTNLVVAE